MEDPMKGMTLATLAARVHPSRRVSEPTSAAPGALRGFAVAVPGDKYRF
jgi:hypothetical protein